jgi:hypothetical protein
LVDIKTPGEADAAASAFLIAGKVFLNWGYQGM